MANEVMIKDMKHQVAAMRGEFAKSLPGHISAEKFVRTTQTAISMTRNIERVKDMGQFLAACTNAAADGLILDGREAAMVIGYDGSVRYQPMMRGLLKLAYNSGMLKSIVVEIVYENDVFDYSPTRADEPIMHRIDLRKPRGNPYAAYAIAVLKDGGVVHEVMGIEDIDRIRDRSDAYRAFKAGKIKSTPWSTDWSEMARKTVFRRLSKYLPSSTDRDALHTAAERIDEDYTFDNEDLAPEAPTPPAKKKGAAASKLKDVTPEPEEKPKAEPAKRAAKKAEPEPTREEDDDGWPGEDDDGIQDAEIIPDDDGDDSDMNEDDDI